MDKLALLTALYDHVLAGTESFELQDIGADLSYLMGAILKDDGVEFEASRPILGVLDGYPQRDLLFSRYIEVVQAQ